MQKLYIYIKKEGFFITDIVNNTGIKRKESHLIAAVVDTGKKLLKYHNLAWKYKHCTSWSSIKKLAEDFHDIIHDYEEICFSTDVFIKIF